jgi:POT family proton-dependent oligopeptide transporter
MTDRQPSRPLAALLDAVPGGKGLLEPAPPSYFENAGAETPTPRAGESLKVVNAEIFQSVNPGFILLLTPLLVAFWAFLRSRGREPSTPSKIGLGLLFIALSMVVMLGAVWFSQATTPPGGKTSPWWLIGTYACVTVGELCLSPMGLSLVSKNSPARIRAFLMGGWFVATSVGGKLSGLCGEIYQRTEPDDFFLVLAGCTALAGGAVFCALPWLRRQLAD